MDTVSMKTRRWSCSGVELIKDCLSFSCPHSVLASFYCGWISGTGRSKEVTIVEEKLSFHGRSSGNGIADVLASLFRRDTLLPQL
jgi:hypothetical protein